jgi:hypothetical protein
MSEVCFIKKLGTKEFRQIGQRAKKWILKNWHFAEVFVYSNQNPQKLYIHSTFNFQKCSLHQICFTLKHAKGVFTMNIHIGKLFEHPTLNICYNYFAPFIRNVLHQGILHQGFSAQ